MAHELPPTRSCSTRRWQRKWAIVLRRLIEAKDCAVRTLVYKALESS
jgi:hypothetical protein